MTIHLAAYRPHRRSDILGRMVCWWTGSPFSHCELVVDGACYSSSARDGGVRAKWIDLDQPWWHLVEIPEEYRACILKHYENTEGIPYGWADILFRQIFHFPLDRMGYFCSEWCAAALGLPDPTTWTPGMLVEYFEGMKQ